MADWDNEDNRDDFDDLLDFLIFEEVMKDYDKSKKGRGGGGEGCYIATCVYGTYNCPEVWTLRRFRDRILRRSAPGRLFIRCYYALSPRLVERFGGSKGFHRFWRSNLDRIVARLQEHGVEDTPYRDE